MLIEKLCAQFGIELSEYQMNAFDKYAESIIKWTERVRLVSPKDLSRLRDRHFADSLLPFSLPYFERNVEAVDIGSGAGLPGIPISICRPDINMTLLESNRKKGLFLKHMVRYLDMKKVRVEIERAEELARKIETEKRYDIALSRAVSSISQIIIWTFPLLKPGGHIIIFKGPNPKFEIDQAEKGLRQKYEFVISVERYDLSDLPITSSLVIVRKVR